MSKEQAIRAVIDTVGETFSKLDFDNNRNREHCMVTNGC